MLFVFKTVTMGQTTAISQITLTTWEKPWGGDEVQGLSLGKQWASHTCLDALQHVKVQTQN